MARRLILTAALLLTCALVLASAQPKTAKAGKAAKQGDSKPESGNTPFGHFMHDGVAWTVYRDKNQRPFYYNTNTGKTTWSDPRLSKPAADTGHLLLFVLLPFALFGVGGAGYLIWVAKTMPDRLKGPKKTGSRAPNRKGGRSASPTRADRGRSTSPSPLSYASPAKTKTQAATVAAPAEEKKEQ